MDFQAISASTGEERKKYLEQLDDGWSHHGCIYFTNHTIGSETVAEAFSWVGGFI